MSYNLIGLKASNFFIDKTFGAVYTSGQNIDSLLVDRDIHDGKNINALVGYTVEGLDRMDEEKIDEYLNEMITSIYAVCSGRPDGHYAFKYTAIVTMDIMTRWSKAQEVFLRDILKFDKKEPIYLEDLKESLVERGIRFTDHEVKTLFESLKFSDNSTDQVSRLEVYANGHLFKLLEKNS